MILSAAASMKPGAPVTLTTDFGLTDHYVGTMKGVILRVCPGATIVDITHQIQPFSIYAGAYAIRQAAPYFPGGTVHVVVVDPGVGTARRPIVIKALDQFFIAPDNGVLTSIMAADHQARCYEITRTDLMLPSPSATFHGRDVFAPVAAAIAAGIVTPDEVGPSVATPQLLQHIESQEIRPGFLAGKILSIDHFGNAITNFCSAGLEILTRTPFSLKIGSLEVHIFHKTFGVAQPEQAFAYHGSSGYIEVAMNQANVSERFGISPGQDAQLEFGSWLGNTSRQTKSGTIDKIP